MGTVGGPSIPQQPSVASSGVRSGRAAVAAVLTPPVTPLQSPLGGPEGVGQAGAADGGMPSTALAKEFFQRVHVVVLVSEVHVTLSCQPLVRLCVPPFPQPTR
jgi:hypothetical protein